MKTELELLVERRPLDWVGGAGLEGGAASLRRLGPEPHEAIKVLPTV